MDHLNPTRRQFLKGSAAAMAVGATASLTGLYSRQLLAAGDPVRMSPIPSPYGALAPVADRSTGLNLLQLPAGFSYQSFAWSGDRMADGQPCPDRHDGMAVVGKTYGRQPRGGGGRSESAISAGLNMVLIRNHERGAATPFDAPGMYDTGDIGNGARSGGGTTNLQFGNGRWQGVEPSLGGTLVNCAGGLTPWGTWLSCEEIKTDAVSSTGRKHGYVFEVHPKAERTTGRPLVGLGRFSHEAVAIDPATGYVYLTEDDRNKSGLYRYVPNDRRGNFGSLENGGRLQAARVRKRPNADLIVATIGTQYTLEWFDVADPDLDTVVAPVGFPDISAGERLSGPFAQAWADGGLRMSRGEGIWYSHGKMFIIDTSTGTDSTGRRGRGEGAVWVLDLRSMHLEALFVSGNQLAANNPDNITVSPRGGLLLCEDGGTSSDEYGPGSRLIGLTHSGESYYFAKNNAELTDIQIAGAEKSVPEGDYRDSEFCGACWDPRGDTLVVNMQSPGITFAITGPWRRGNQ